MLHVVYWMLAGPPGWLLTQAVFSNLQPQKLNLTTWLRGVVPMDVVHFPSTEVTVVMR